MRGRMRSPELKSYSPPYTLGEACTAYALIQVIKSNNEKYQKGDIVYGQFPVSEYSVVSEELLARNVVRKAHQIENAPLSNWLSILGSTGLKVIGSVGDDGKLDFIKQNGFDDGFNYKKEKPADALKRLAPQGIDIYYDNVGGEQLEAAIAAMKNFGRIGMS